MGGMQRNPGRGSLPGTLRATEMKTQPFLSTHGLGKPYRFQSLFSHFLAGKDLSAEKRGGGTTSKNREGTG